MKKWTRKYWEKGGGDALLMYLVYGSFPRQLQCSESVYRTRGLPSGVGSWRKARLAESEWFSTWEQGYFGESLRKSGLFKRVSGAPEVIVIQGAVVDPRDLLYLRDCIGVIASLMDMGGQGILDPQMLQWWSPEDWKETFWSPDDPSPRRHTVILHSEENASAQLWYHTRGMRKFGRPDLSMHHVPRAMGPDVVDLFERFIELQAFGALVPDGESIRMASLPPGLVCNIRGTLADEDFNNMHIEVSGLR